MFLIKSLQKAAKILFISGTDRNLIDKHFLLLGNIRWIVTVLYLAHFHSWRREGAEFVCMDGGAEGGGVS